MTARVRAYCAETDYMAIRQFVIDTFGLYGGPHNWLIDRWNVCRFVVVPIHQHFNVSHFGVPTRPHELVRDELALWEATIGVWEDATGEIVGVVHSENESPGEVWFETHPAHEALNESMLDWAEEKLADRVDGLAFCKLYLPIDCSLEAVAAARGYRMLAGKSPWMAYDLSAIHEGSLPERYAIRSVAEEDDIDKLRRAKALAFGGGYAPSDWAPAAVYRQVRRAPDYDPALDLVVVAPDGDYAAFTTIWMDRVNRYGVFEPVGTVQEQQGRGIGRALLAHGLRLMAEQGATRSYMNSGNPFYRKIGFKDTGLGQRAWIRYWEG